jgi:tRNA(fMet)-specific endonuclease VapC
MFRRLILDCGPAFDYFFDRRDIRDRVHRCRRSGMKTGICKPIFGEIIGGVELGSSRDHSWSVVHRSLSKFVLWPYTREAAYECGRLFATLKRSGITIQQNDLQMAAIALTLGNCTVVSYDTDLTRVPSLKVENWPLDQNAM